ncbi:hypothetical protein [Haloarchaeobius sp. DYHT-AS-18]|uniref:hypothetical protein n=1 Tax=Haloarchaeobius sp. DYHT-AS-18 TaxID=3446117 RepID=UPI003EB6F4BB
MGLLGRLWRTLLFGFLISILGIPVVYVLDGHLRLLGGVPWTNLAVFPLAVYAAGDDTDGWRVLRFLFATTTVFLVLASTAGQLSATLTGPVVALVPVLCNLFAAALVGYVLVYRGGVTGRGDTLANLAGRVVGYVRYDRPQDES